MIEAGTSRVCQPNSPASPTDASICLKNLSLVNLSQHFSKEMVATLTGSSLQFTVFVSISTNRTGGCSTSASHNYAKRVKDTFKSVKTALLVDCNSGAILDVHCSMNLPHDTQIAWQALTRNLDQLETVVADKGFDWDDLRHKLREEGIRPVIKHREFYSLDAAHNARIDDDVYHRRSIVEAIFFSLRKRFGSTTRARTWFGQFREIVLKAAVRNLERAVRL